MKRLKVYECEECGGAISNDGKLSEKQWKKRMEEFAKKHTHRGEKK